MKTKLIFAMTLLGATTHCKSPNSKGSEAKAWVVDASEEKGTERIKAIVYKFYGPTSEIVQQTGAPPVPERSSVVDDFARAIQENKIDQTETSDYVRNLSIGQDAETFDKYIIQEFISQTNYLEYIKNPDAPLQMIKR